MKQKKLLRKVFKPTSEKLFVSSLPFFPIIPIVAFVISNFFVGHGGIVGKFFFLVGYVSYIFVSIFAIPFEGILQYLGMMQFGGGIFDSGFRGMDLGGIFLVQLTYAMIFYGVYSVTSHFRKQKCARKMRYPLGRRS